MLYAKEIMKFGIVGYGAFGSLLARLLSGHGQVMVFDQSSERSEPIPPGVMFTERYGDLAGCSAVFIATPLESIRDVCEQLSLVVQDDMIVADVCSVKVKPAQVMQEILGGRCRLLATHPLFGPQTVSSVDDVAGKKLVWHEISDEGGFGPLRELFEQGLGIEIVEVSPEEHDREMAWVHGLTFFAGKALLSMNPPTSTLGTNYYQKLLDLVEVEKGHSDELFMTIQQGNPYTDDIRREFMNSLQKLEDHIAE